MYVPDMPTKPERTASDNARDAIVWGLGAVSFGLSGWSLTTLLMSVGTPFMFALLGVGVFDLLALLAALQVYERRNEPHKGAGARLVMLLALIASSVVNANHGLEMGGWPTAVVFGGAPLVFEIGFEIRHRSLTGLIWVLFFKEAKDALKRDAWVRIAPATEPPTGPQEVPAVLLERADLPADQYGTENTAGNALTAGNAPAGHEIARPADTSAQVSDAGNARLPASDNGLPAPTTGTTEPTPAPLAHDSEPVPAPQPLAAAGAPGTVEMGKPHIPATPLEGKPLGKPRPVSMAQAVREVVATGVTDDAGIKEKVPALLGREVKETSLLREIRRQRPQIEAAQAAGTGQYL